MEDKIICHCMDVSEHEIVDAIKNKEAQTVQDIMDITGAGTACGSCIGDLEDILKRELNQ
jgi:NAD(P)H-nitrite reductase large subunit